MKRIKYILLEADITLASFMMGLALVAWGLVAVFKAPNDFFAFSDAMRIGNTWFWLFNYLSAGAGFLYVAYKNLPSMPSLLIGSYAILVWTWVASIRDASNLTSGVVLNLIVILMGLLLVQRSSKSNDF